VLKRNTLDTTTAIASNIPTTTAPTEDGDNSILPGLTPHNWDGTSENKELSNEENEQPPQI
jgi:hypothetical protein